MATVVSCARQAGERQAVFLIVVDTLRPDRLSCYGYAEHQTPNIDAIANAGMRFDNAQAVASWTLPSMGAMMTSKYPAQLGLVERPEPALTRFQKRQRRVQIRYTPSPEAHTLAELMSEAGFRSAAFVDQPALCYPGGFIQGFHDWYYAVEQTYDEYYGTDTDRVRKHPIGEEVPHEPAPAGPTSALGSDIALIETFTEWLEDNANESVFAWLHLLTPHHPYQPPVRYGQQFVKQGDGWVEVPPSQRYDGEVRATDDLVGKILEAIDAFVGRENALIIFTSDHGEAFDEHDTSGHGQSLHREVISVPLIIAGPNIPSGESSDAYVSTIDILPTILDAVDVTVPVPGGIEGESLLASGGGPTQDRLVFSQGMLYGSTERSLISDGVKLMYDAEGAVYSLYDVVADRGETQDVMGKQPEVEKRLRAGMDRLMERLAKEYESAAHASTDSTEVERALKMMRALGYVND